MNTFYRKALLPVFIGFLLFTTNANCQIVINEVCPTNIAVIQNSNGKFDDYVELHNSGSSSINLAGYGLTDDLTKPFRFTFPNYNLLSTKKILVFTSDSTSEVIADHWEMAIDAATSWKYAAGSASIDTNWRNPSFNPNGWASGNGGIGWGDSDDGTSLGTGISVMMRKTFTIADTSLILKAVLSMDYDDGFVAYLNGVEIARANIGTAGVRPQWNELALSSHEALKYQGLPIDSFFLSPALFKTLLIPGTNVLAIETHNVTASSNDLSSIPYLFFGMKNPGLTYSAVPSWLHVPLKDYFNAHFKLTRNGETVYLFNPSGTMTDQITFPAMQSNNSYGRKPDGNASWCLMSVPTPDATNNTVTCYNGYALPPVFSRNSGYYPSTQTITLSQNTPGGSIRFTTNGDVPTTSSRLYTSAITVSSSMSIRAKVFASGYLPSETVSNTYIINASTHLPTFTITTDSLNLWDYNTGIYVLGPGAASTSPYKGANFWQDWDKPATIEYYDKYKNFVVRFDADIEIYGNYSRAKPQKSFEIKMSDRYGTGELAYSFYTDKPFIDKVDDLVLRNSGTDWNKVHFRDALMERLMKPTYCGYIAAEPAIMYLNGNYWGVYTIHENHDTHWMKTNFGYDKDQVDYLKEDGSSLTLKNGSDATFWNLYNYATVQSATSSTYYDQVNSMLDLKNYADYFIAETYYDNGDWIGDWTNNIKMWRHNTAGSKWRYLLYDTDFGLGFGGNVNNNRLSIARNPAAFSISSEMFDAILKNPAFKRYFINRYADLINTIYLPSNVDAVMKSFRDSMSFDMPAHFAKWGSTVSDWQSNITGMMNFANARPNKMRDFINSEFTLAGKVTLTLQTSPAGSGRIEISTITPTSYPWSGVYFNGNPVTITAIPNPGYSFDHWRSASTITSNNLNQSVTYNFSTSDAITAYFTGSATTAKLSVSELNYNSDSAYNAGDWIELHNYGTTSLNISGWQISDGADNHMYTFPTGTTIAANAYLVVVEDSDKFKSQFPSVNNRIGELGFNFSNGGDQIRIFNSSNILYQTFFYQDLAPWPLTPDGGGYTCEHSSDLSDPNDGNNWFAGCIGGSPGKAYSPILAIPVTISGTTTFCAGNTATLNATYVSGYTYQWRRNNINISGATDSTFIADQSGAYSVNIGYNGCSIISPPTTISVVTQQPNPVVTPASRCGAGELTLFANSTDTVFWYDAISGGNLVDVGDTLETPFLSSSTTYYAQSGRNCSSAFVPVAAMVNAQTAAPVTSDITRCGPGTATLSANDTASIRWYNMASGGGLLETGSSFTTNLLINDTSYFVEAGNACPSPRIEVFVHVNTADMPVVTDASRCDNGTLTLTATANDPVTWYNNYTGGSSIGSGTTFTTGVLSISDTLYAQANGSCPSVRSRGIAIVNHTPSVPVTSDTTICAAGSVTLHAMATEAVNWYDASSGGNLLFSGSSFATPMLTSTTTYYVGSGYDCPSSRVAVNANIGTAAFSPTVTDGSRCGAGTVTMSATSADNLYWYTSATGGTAVATGSTFTTPSLSASANYYVEAGDVCKSARVLVQAIINSTPSAPVTTGNSRCGTGTVVLSATSSSTVNWYAASTGGTSLGTGLSFTTPSVSSTTTYYAESANGNCPSVRTAAVATVSSPPSAPVLVTASRCGAGSVTVSANSTSTVNWFSSATGGSLIASGLSFTTPLLSATTTYYAEANNGCVSTRASVQAVINSVPASPVTSDQTRCGAGVVTLNATSPEQVYWYSSATSSTVLSTGLSFTTPTLSSTTTYYLEAGNTCRSSRISVQAIINISPAAPSSSNVSICGNGTVTFSATSTSSLLRWYDAATGGINVGSGTSFTTPSLSSNTNYYVEAGVIGCESPRTQVSALINSVPAVPVATGSFICGPGSVSLSATSSMQMYWYSSSTSNTILDSGSTFNTPVINSTRNYFVATSNGLCQSARVQVQAAVTPLPSPPVANSVSRCGAGIIQLSAVSSQSVYWYDAATGGNLLSTTAAFTTTNLTSSATYYVEAGATCRSHRIAVQALIVSAPSSPVLFDTSRCGPGSAEIRAVSNEQVNWFDVPTGGVSLATGLLFSTPSINAHTIYYAEAGIGCNSQRVSVDVNIDSLPASPVTTDSSRCGAGTLNLSATASQTVYWYDSFTSTTPLHTGNQFTTPSISATTIYYAETGDNCRSIRVPVNAIINTGSQVNTVVAGQHCGAGIVLVSAFATGADSLLWYDHPGGTNIGSGEHFLTPFINSTTTYYVVAVSSCTGAAVPVVANIYSDPVVNLGVDTVLLQTGQTITLDAGSGYPDYDWSTSETNESIIVSAQGNYSVTVTDNHGCSGSDNVFVSVITGLSDPGTSDANINLFPNPATGKVMLSVSNLRKEIHAKLITTDGRILNLFEIHPSTSELIIPVSLENISPGIYLITLENAELKKTFRLTVF